MKKPPIPVPLILLFGLAAAAVVVLFAWFAPGAPAVAPDGAVRLRFVGDDGKPRAGVQGMLGRSVAFEPDLLPVSGPDGHVDGTAPEGTYELRVYPKRLASADARAKFRSERSGDPGAIDRVRFFVTTVKITRDVAPRREVRLPGKAGY